MGARHRGGRNLGRKGIARCAWMIDSYDMISKREFRKGIGNHGEKENKENIIVIRGKSGREK
jgi:hypothetical protein